MTDYTEELKRKAEEFAISITDKLKAKRTLLKEEINQRYAGIVQGFEFGYEQGYEDCRHYAHDYYKPKWHDSRNDFPEDKRKGDEFCCKLEDKTLDLEWYEILIWDIEYQTEDIYQVPVGYMFKSLKTGKDMSDYVIAWCELPKFEGGLND